jgi:hypothetical protein
MTMTMSSYSAGSNRRRSVPLPHVSLFLKYGHASRPEMNAHVKIHPEPYKYVKYGKREVQVSVDYARRTEYTSTQLQGRSTGQMPYQDFTRPVSVSERSRPAAPMLRSATQPGESYAS